MRIGAGSGTQGNGLGRVPGTQLRSAAGDQEGLAFGGGLYMKGDGGVLRRARTGVGSRATISPARSTASMSTGRQAAGTRLLIESMSFPF